MDALQRYAKGLVGFVWLMLGMAVAVPNAVGAEPITIFAASSLRDALGEVADVYGAENDTEVVLVFAASSAIARQVAQGAPADAVLLADAAWADWLVQSGAIDQAVPVAGNRLVLVGLNAAPINTPQNIPAMLGDDVLAMAQVDAVPAGRYGKAALISLNLWDEVSDQVVQAANVRAALRFVERGEAAFGIGYASDLVALPSLTEVYQFAPHTHPDIIYSGAGVTPQGAEFMIFLQSEVAQDTLVRWGFAPRQASQ